MLVKKLVARLTDPIDLALIDDLTDLMARLLVPLDYRRMLIDAPSLVFEVDRRTDSIQWEMIKRVTYADGVGIQSAPGIAVALAVPVARQLRTSADSRKAIDGVGDENCSRLT